MAPESLLLETSLEFWSIISIRAVNLHANQFRNVLDQWQVTSQHVVVSKASKEFKRQIRELLSYKVWSLGSHKKLGRSPSSLLLATSLDWLMMLESAEKLLDGQNSILRVEVGDGHGVLVV